MTALAEVSMRIPVILEDAENGLSARFRHLLDGLRENLVYLDLQITIVDQGILRQANENAMTKKLQQLRGIGPVTATALVAAIGNGKDFKRGRDLAAWLGLVPGQHSSGGKDRLLGISKRGNVYLRTLIIHGARAVVRAAPKQTDRLSCWIQSLCARRTGE